MERLGDLPALVSNRAALIRSQVLAKYPDATVAERGRKHLRFQAGNRNVLVASIDDLHYQSGGWQEIDTTVQPSNDAAFDDEVDQTPYRVRVKDGNRRVWPRRDVPDEYIDFGRPEFQRTNGRYAVIPWDGRRREGNTVVFFRNDAELRVTFAGGRIKMNLVLLSAPSSTRWRFPVSITGLTRQGARLVSNRDGTTVATLAPFELDDAAGIHRDIAGTFGGHPDYQGAYVVQPDLSGLTYPVVIDPTVDVSVAASGDDGRWASGSFNNASVGINISNGGNGFFRFTGLSALDGATIDVAYLTVVASSTLTANTASVTIRAAAADNQAAPTTEAECTAPTRTTASVNWSAIQSFTSGSSYNTPSIVSVIQEMADNGYLASGVALIYLEDNAGSAARGVSSYDHLSNAPPALHVEYSTTQNLSPSLLTNTSTVYTPTLNPGAVSVEPPLLTNTSTVYTPTVSPGTVTISPSLLTNSNTIYTPTVEAGTIIAPDLLTNTSTVYQPTLQPGPVSIEPDLLTNTQTFYTPTLTATYTVTPDLLTNTSTVYQPTLTAGAVTIEPDLLTNTSTIYGPTLTAAAVTISPELLTNTQTFYTPTLSPGAVTISPDLLTNASTLFTPAVGSATSPLGLMFTRLMRADALRVNTPSSQLRVTVTSSALRQSVDPTTVRVEPDDPPLRVTQR